jgi:hypothetical protein
MPSSTTYQTSTSSTAPSNPDVNPTLSKLLKGVQGQYDATPEGFAFDKSLYAGTGATTDNALSTMLSGATNPAAGQAFGNTFSEVSDIAAGNRFGMDDPGYAALRSKVASDTLTGTNRAFNESGLFGADSNQRAAGEGLANALAGLDYGNFQNDQQRQERAQASQAGAFQNTLLPGQAALGVGQLQDADAQAALQGESDLALRQFNAPTDFLAKLSSILAGNAASGGTSSSTTTPIQQPNPLQLLLSGGLGAAGLFL